MSTYIIAIVILTLFSGLFSATETAYSSSSKIRLKNMANDGKTKASSVLVILDDFDMSNVFDYHFIYVRNAFSEQDFKKANYALFIQQKEISH